MLNFNESKHITRKYFCASLSNFTQKNRILNLLTLFKELSSNFSKFSFRDRCIICKIYLLNNKIYNHWYLFILINFF